MALTPADQQVLEVCDRIVVLRLGRKLADRPIAGLTGPMVVGYITERADA
jgi:ABC-type sugar transport system ATPase subunit